MQSYSTVAQYNYTPFVQTQVSTGGFPSGGVLDFERIWFKYDNNSWYQ